MKRFFSLSLCFVLLMGILCSCANAKKTCRGAGRYERQGSCLRVRDDGKTTYFDITEDTELIWSKEAQKFIQTWSTDAWEMLQEDPFDGWTYLAIHAAQVTVTYRTETERPKEASVGEGEIWYLAESVKVLEMEFRPLAPEKPVIYLYPEAETDVSVLLDYSGRLTCTYPAYREGWHVTASPDGTLTDASGQTYNYLYWEGIGTEKYDFSRGFCVSGADTAAFLEDALSKLGLTRREANEFIVYWLPRMEQNPYNLIAFQGDAYTESARLTVTPTPDTLIRVFMAFRPLSEPTPIEPQALSAPARTGFTVVEWGGAEITEE